MGEAVGEGKGQGRGWGGGGGRAGGVERGRGRWNGREGQGMKYGMGRGWGGRGGERGSLVPIPSTRAPYIQASTEIQKRKRERSGSGNFCMDFVYSVGISTKPIIAYNFT